MDRLPFPRALVAMAALASVAFGAIAVAAPADLPVVSAAALQRDALVLRRTYEALHPGLYRYNSPSDVARSFAALEQDLDHDQTALDAFLAFTRFTSTLRCGHSYPNFHNQPASIKASLTADDNRLPFHFVWIDGTMVVTKSFADDAAIAPGTVIEAIDGVPTRNILATLLPLARADGHNDAKRVDLLQVQGFERIEPFDVYFGLTFARGKRTFDLRLANGTTPSSSIRVRGIGHAERLAQMPKTAKPSSESPLGWSLAYPSGHQALLTMPTWVTYNSDWDWRGYLTGAFAELKARGVGHLIVDLRGNEGGTSVGDEIAAHLIDRDLVMSATVRRVRYRRVPDALRPTLETWDRSFFDWGEAAQGPDADGFYRLTRYDDSPEGSVITPVAPRFDGRLDVLVDASNSSATFEFARLVQARKLGRLVGQPTGGNQRGINGGAFFFLRLPESKIEVDVPLIGQFPARPAPDAGLTPDVVVSRTPQDVSRGVDPVLRTALGESPDVDRTDADGASTCANGCRADPTPGRSALPLPARLD